MRKAGSILLAAAAVLISLSIFSAAAAFPDVPETSRYSKAIGLLKELSVVGGDESGNFNPDSTITRAEFAKIVYVLYNGTPEAPKAKSAFPDVAADAWYNGYVNWAAEKGIVGGRDTGLFDPAAPVSFAEASKMFVVAMTGENDFAWPLGFIEKAENLGLYEGASYGEPNDPAARGLVAQLAANAVYGQSVLLSGVSPAEKHFGLIKTVNLKDYGAYVKNGDWQPAFAKALLEADKVYVPAGTYNVSRITVPSNKTIYGDGDKTVLVALSSTVFYIRGTESAEVALARDMADFSDSFTLKSSLGLKAGDLVYIQSQRNCLILEDCGPDWCQGRTYYSGKTTFFAEYLTVKSVSGNSVTTETKTIFPYYYADGSRESDPKKPTSEVADWPYRRASSTVRKITPAENILLKDMRIEANGGTIISAKWIRNSVYDGINLYTSKTEPAQKNILFVWMSEGLDCEIKNCGAYFRGGISIDPGKAYSQYDLYRPFMLVSSVRCGFESCYGSAGTHIFLIGKGDKRGTGYDNYVKNCTAENSAWSGVYVSQGAYRTVITGNKVNNCPTGIMVSGRAAYISGNTIDLSGLNTPLDHYYVRTAQGGKSGITLVEGYSIDAVIENNTIKRADTGINIRDGYEDTNIFTHGKITVKNNTFINCARERFLWKNDYNKGSSTLVIDWK